MKKIYPLLDNFEKIFVVLSLFHYSAAFLPVILTGGASEGDGFDLNSADWTLNRSLFLLNYLIVPVLLALRWKKTISILPGNYLLFALMAYLPISFLWSAKPDETIAGSIRMIGTVLFGIYIASRFTLKEQLRLICWMFSISIILSILFIILLPQYGVMGGVHAGAFRGVYTHKNMFGKAMVLGTAIFLVFAKSSTGRNWYAWLGVALAFALTLLSSSSSSLLNGAMLVMFVLSVEVLRLRGKNFWIALVLIAALIFALSQWSLVIAETVVESVGKDMTLTGRTDIWPLTISKIQERPWLGYGFNGFWHGINGESLYMTLAVGWSIPSSHNGFLDLILELGFLGFSLFFLLLWTLLMKCISLLRYRFSWEYVWPLTFLAYTMIINFTETDLIAQNSLSTVLLVATSISINYEFRQLTSNYCGGMISSNINQSA